MLSGNGGRKRPVNKRSGSCRGWEEEECARREQQRADEVKKQVEEAEAQRKAE